VKCRTSGRWCPGKLPGLIEPVEITSIQTFLRVGPDSATPAEILVDDLIATVADGSKHLVIDFDSPGLWTGLPTAEGNDTVFTITDERPAPREVWMATKARVWASYRSGVVRAREFEGFTDGQ
jgi:hypothetical protein